MANETARAAATRAVAAAWPGIGKIVSIVPPRPIAKSSKQSEHSWGNALDIYGTVEALNKLAKYLDANRSRLSIRIICWDGGGSKYDTCTTKHIDHMHVDFSPNCGGNVSSIGSAAARSQRCNDYQGGNTVTTPLGPIPTGEQESEGDGLFGIPGAVRDFGERVENLFESVLFVGVGVLLIAGGAILFLKDTELGNTVKAVATKGIA